MNARLSLSLDETREGADFIIEGTIGFKYYDLIPGLSPRRWGIHWLFASEELKVQKSPAFPSDRSPIDAASLFAQLGFWTRDGNPDQDLRCNIGDQVCACLEIISGDGGYMVLSPVHGSEYGVFKTSSGKPLFAMDTADCPNKGLPDDYPKLTIAYGVTTDMNRYGDDLAWAAKRWNDATGSEIRVFPSFMAPAYSHYVVFFSPLVPDNLLADTEMTRQGHRPWGTAEFEIRFNSNKVWSSPGSSANDNEFDFRSIAMHEIGHAIGLGHLNGSPLNIMEKGLEKHEVRVTPQTDDLECMEKLLHQTDNSAAPYQQRGCADQ